MRAIQSVIVALLIGAGLHRAALAQSADTTAGISSSAGSITLVTLAPGAIARGDLLLPYEGDAPLAARVVVLDYRVGPDGPISQPSLGSEPFSAAGWITVSPDTPTLRPGRTETIHYRIQVPTDAAAGDYDGVVQLLAEQADLQLSRRIIVTVPGEAPRDTVLSEFAALVEPVYFFAYPLPIALPVWAGGPIRLRVRAENRGSFASSVGGAIELHDLLGRNLERLDLPAVQILPGDVATYEPTWATPPAVGLVTARLRLEVDGSTIVEQTRLVILPWQQMIAALLVLLALRLLLGGRLALPVSRTGRSASADAAGNGEVAGVGDRKGVAPDARPGPALAATSENGSARPDLISETFLRGQHVARAGERLAAYNLFLEVLAADPLHEEAWLWRAGTSDNLDEMRRCLQRVLEINPNNQRAQQGMAEVERRLKTRAG